MAETLIKNTTGTLPGESELTLIVEQVLDEARRQGASDAEAAVSVGTGLSVQVRQGEVDTVEHQRDRSLAVAVYFGLRQGTASSADFSPASIRATVEAACAIARHTSEDPAQGLADPDRLARDIPELDMYHPWALDADRAITLALEAERVALGADPRITNSDGAGVSSNSGIRVYGNSRGFIGGVRSTRHGINCMVIASDDQGMQRDYWYTVNRVPGELEPAEDVGRKAAANVLRRLGSRRLGTRKVPVVFQASMARGLLGQFVGAVRGGSLYRKASFLLDQLGQPVFADWVTLTERPHLSRALGSAPFDHEGVATRQRDLVAGGVLQGYVLDSYSARKLGMETTGNAGGVHNLLLHPGDKDLDGLLAEMGTGLLVTEMMGQGVNMVTGDYSRGAAGFWVEGGEIAYPVQEITVAGNMKTMLRNMRAAGNDVDIRGAIHSGSILVDEMTVAGE
ncbi:MAG: metalloprotease PmbA [Ectothiorhodospiraceae bacterium]|nr:metalloprotease PmbA [Ectothiorhodospiraceae bacterium]